MKEVSKYLDFGCGNSENIMKAVKNYIDTSSCSNMSLDLSCLNIFDATKVMVLSSTYHNRKYPKGKLKCRVESESVKKFVSSFVTENLEVVSA